MKLLLMLQATLLILLISCHSRQKVLVYERLPQFQECARYTDYIKVKDCDLSELKKQNVELDIILENSKQRLESIYNQSDRCAYRNKLPRPVGCDLSIVPRRGNRPIVGRGIEN